MHNKQHIEYKLIWFNFSDIQIYSRCNPVGAVLDINLGQTLQSDSFSESRVCLQPSLTILMEAQILDEIGLNFGQLELLLRVD
jgi:hypothetical protein